ncbi:GrpB family protein [Sulfobacillus harzensis]|uniref:GrpB family protein n=1 Tax=Sulfobacillus harzensis TaxID=2729629 RepID=A0A7Y0Q2M9_9FIRM|nr:GrpB family protein [Sulfobacillus harzensis]NMP22697.1 GrpB family protein [Sulfobacillus harzensis]
MKVRLTAHNDNWARKFEEEAAVLRPIFGENVVTFEHFGSTVVPGLPAKPVIDMMCIVQSIEKIDACSEQMAALGYDVAGEWGILGRRLFRKGGDDRTHHVQVYEVGSPQIYPHLVVRDHLRAHPEEVERYGQLKEVLAQRWDDTRDYSPAKKPFVQALEQRALRWDQETRA